MSRFATLLDLFSAAERDAKIELGRRLHQREQLAAERAALHAALLAAGGDVPLALHEQYHAHWRGVQARLGQYDVALGKADAAINDARKALAEAHQRRTTIDKLRERDLAAARRRDERREQRMQDDRAASTWAKERS
jgi:flagellar export protein FliJ